MTLKKTLALLISAILTFSLIIPCLVITASAEAVESLYTDNQLKITVSTGYNSDFSFENDFTPVYFTVSNNTGKDIEGTAELYFTYQCYPQIVDGSPSVTESIFVADGSTKNFRISNFTAYNNYALLLIRDKSGKILGYGATTTAFSESNSILHIGIVCDEAKNGTGIIDLYNGYANNYQSSYTLTAVSDVLGEVLTPERFPENLFEIQKFNLIIIGDADFSASSKFTQKQISLLYDYIDCGGSVLISADSQGKNLSAFASYFDNTLSAAIKRESVKGLTVSAESFTIATNDTDSSGSSYYSKKSWSSSEEYKNAVFSVKLDSAVVTEVNDDNFSVAFENNGARIYRHIKYDLYISNFDVTSKEFRNYSGCTGLIIALMERAGADMYLTDISLITAPETALTKYTSAYPNLFVAGAVILVFAIIGIVIPFIISKKKKKSRYLWVGVPACSVAFSAILLAYSSFLHGVSPISNTMVFERLSDCGESVISYSTTVASPTGGVKLIGIAEEDPCYIGNKIVSNYYNSNYAGISYSPSKSGVYSESLTAWQNAQAYAYTSKRDCGKFAAYLTLNDSDCSVTITNNTGRDLSDCTAIILGNLYYIGDLTAGSSYTAHNVGQSYVVPTALELIQKVYGNRYGISDQQLNNEYYNNVSYYKGGYTYSSVSYYSSYPYSYYGYPDYENFKFLKSIYDESHEDYFRAVAMTIIMQNQTVEDITVFGFDPAADVAAAVNGKAISRRASTFAVYQNIETYDDLSGIESADYSCVPTLVHDCMMNCNTIYDDFGNSQYRLNGSDAWLGLNTFYNRQITEDKNSLSVDICGSDVDNLKVYALIARDTQNKYPDETYVKAVELKKGEDGLYHGTITELVDCVSQTLYETDKYYSYYSYDKVIYYSSTVYIGDKTLNIQLGKSNGEDELVLIIHNEDNLDAIIDSLTCTMTSK